MQCEARRQRLVLITSGMTSLIEPLSESPNDLVGIAQSRPRGEGGVRARLKSRIVGGYVGFRALARGQGSIKGYCRSKRIPYFFMRRGSCPVFREWVNSLSPDLMVVYSMAELLPRNVFGIPRLGTINLHPSLLPAYRGPDPLLWQYLLFDRDHGITIHHIDSGKDTGGIIAQRNDRCAQRIARQTGLLLQYHGMFDATAKSFRSLKRDLNS